jgi:hypothetical protein
MIFGRHLDPSAAGSPTPAGEKPSTGAGASGVPERTPERVPEREEPARKPRPVAQS